MSYQHLTIDQRFQLYELRRSGASFTKIGREMGIHRTTVSRELGRLGSETRYWPHTAQEDYKRCQKRRCKPVTGNLELMSEVERRLKLDHSP